MPRNNLREKWNAFLKNNFRRDNLILDLLFISLLIVPFINIVDVAWMFTSLVTDEWYVLHTPFAIKLLKDFIVISFVGVSFLSVSKLSKYNFYAFVAIIFILIAEIIFSFFQYTSLPLIVVGTRWILPILLFPLLSNCTITNKQLTNFLNRYRFILIVAIILQIFQILFSTRWGVCSQDGCRASGFFAMPQPQSFFALFFIFFAKEAENYKFRKFDYALGVLSILLTKSAAGFLGLFSFFFIISNSKLKLVTGVIGTIIMVLFPFVTGRASFWESPLVRLSILTENNFQIPHFGAYTNSCFNFKYLNSFNDSVCKVPDSFLTSILGNLGIFLGMALLGILLYLIVKSQKYLYLFIFLIMLIGGSYTEYFPINIFFPLILFLQVKKE